MSDTSITTILRYENPKSAAEWLCGAFGFVTQHVAQDGDGDVSFISLSFGNSDVLICPTDSALFEELIVQPKEIGNRSTLTCYLTVEDVAEHCANARAHGARIVREPLADAAGHDYYVCRDPDGHLWSFGNRTYAQATHKEIVRRTPRRPWTARVAALLAVVATAAAAGGGGTLYLVKEGREALPAWLNTFVVETVGVDAGKTRRLPQTAAGRRGGGVSAGDEARFAKLQSALKTARADLEQARHQHEAAAAALRDKIKARQSALAQAEARATQLATTIATLKAKLETGSAEKTAAYVRLERLYRQSQENAEERRRALEQARKEVTQAKSANASFAARIAEINERLDATLRTLKTVRAEKNKAIAELDRVVAETRAKQEAHGKQHAENVVTERLATKERAQFKATVEALNARLQRMLAALVEVRREKVAADQTLETTKQETGLKFEDKEKRLVALAAAYERVEHALKKERLSLDEIVRAFEATRLQLARVRAAEKKLSAELSEARAQLKSSRHDIKVRVAILQMFDTEAEVQRAERELTRKRQEPPPPLPTPKGNQQPTTVVAVPQQQQPPTSSADAPEGAERPSPAGSETCSRAARRRLSNFLGWRSSKSISAITYLCRGAETSVEPVECFRKVIWGSASWGRGGNRPWSVKNALTLCSGTLSARLTLLCLRRQLQARAHWRTAIEQCTTNW